LSPTRKVASIGFAEANPLSTVSGLLGDYLMGTTPVPLFGWTELLVFSAVFIFARAGLYAAIIERSV
jgi:hypothetical protein